MYVTKKASAGLVEYEAQLKSSSGIAIYVLLSVSFIFAVYSQVWWLLPAIIVATSILRITLVEKLTIIKGIGLQKNRRGALRLFSDTSKFIPKHTVRAVVINEVFEGFEIKYVLQAFIDTPLDDTEEVMTQIELLLPTARPPLKVLKDMRANANDI